VPDEGIAILLREGFSIFLTTGGIVSSVPRGGLADYMINNKK
jgi:hypothetical protein